MPPYRPILDRFIEKFELDPDTGCWNWTAGLSRKGYARFQISAKKPGEAHRVSYELFKGDIPPNLEIDHICRNRKCVNPHHLRLLTHWENTDHDRRKTHCEAGHPYTEGSYRIYKTKYGIGRWCKECEKLRRAKKEGVPCEALGTREHPRKREFCNNGHPITKGSYFLRKGSRYCKTCHLIWRQAYNAKRKAKRKQSCNKTNP